MKAMMKYIPPKKPEGNGHWGRFRRLVAITAAAAAVAVTLALIWLKAVGAPLGLHMVIATIIGIGGSIILAGVLMALAFLSARSGMDDTTDNHDKDNR